MMSSKIGSVLKLCYHRNSYQHLSTQCRKKVKLLSVQPICQRSFTNKANIDENATPSLNKNIKLGPGIEHFIANSSQNIVPSKRTLEKISHPYVAVEDISGNGRKVYFEVYGCQMNVSDVEVTWAVLQSVGYIKTEHIENADVILIMTCAIREGAETKIWNKINNIKHLKKKRGTNHGVIPIKIGILGCMAERLKKDMLEKEKAIDLVMGPDSYRDLPRLLAITQTGEKAVNVLLSQEETYADIVPVSLSQCRVSAFVSIMRGCDNMCSYCIVPFTRGRERSRPIASILEEVRSLSNQGIKEVTLLGQNVNSYCDTSESFHTTAVVPHQEATHLSEGFRTIYKPKKGGLRFSALLEKVSEINPEMRIRFTSPHPKDFPDEVLTLISERHNICNQIHLPAQSGNSRILEIMRRGYTRESYLKLVEHIRKVIPDVALSSDFICGFCSETEDEFQDSMSLMEEVSYNFCYVFPYSLREKTPAHRDLCDDVPDSVKADRLNRLHTLFRRGALARNTAQVGERQMVLVEGKSRRSDTDYQGRNDRNTRVVFPVHELQDVCSEAGAHRSVQPGDYVEVVITHASSQSLRGVPLAITALERGVSATQTDTITEIRTRR